MATKSVTQLTEVKREDGIDTGLSGLMHILMRRTYRGDPNYNNLGGTDRPGIGHDRQSGLQRPYGRAGRVGDRRHPGLLLQPAVR